ncbi:MAG TPA: hypothetical protein VEZ42_17410, partial [Pseudonocardia sp.]|nr:hypothetical protein [Pseudonocardia sp.]
MAEHPSRGRRFRLVLVLLVVAAVWLVRSRRAVAQPAWEEARPLPRPPAGPRTAPAPAPPGVHPPAPAPAPLADGTPAPRPTPRPARAATTLAPEVS